MSLESKTLPQISIIDLDKYSKLYMGQTHPKKLFLLFAFYGSQFRYADKLAKFYVSKNYAVIVHILPKSVMFFFEGLYGVRDGDQIFKRSNLKQTKFLAHSMLGPHMEWFWNSPIHIDIEIMSGGGMETWLAFERNVQQIFPASQFAIYADMAKDAKIIMDSCPPSYGNLSAFWNVVMETQPNMVAKFFASLFVYTFVIFWTLFDYAVSIGLIHPFSPINPLIRTIGNRKVFCIYSEKDNICPPPGIESFIQQFREKNGQKSLDFIKFADTLHVQAYRQEKDVYENVISQFLELS